MEEEQVKNGVGAGQEEDEKKNEYAMVSLKLSTKERLYKLKNMEESWDEVVNRILDKVETDGKQNTV
jgi:hypothetical protein